jgi:hypothetical protein
MAKYEERKVPLSDPLYGSPMVTVRRVDLVFGKIPLSDARLRPYWALDRRVVKGPSDESAEVIVHCVDHDVLVDGATWGISETMRDRPYEWCPGCERVRADHAPAEEELRAADEARKDAHAARYPVSRRWDESEAHYTERLARVKALVGRQFSQDIEAALTKLASNPGASGLDVLAEMISSRYGDQEIDVIKAIVARRSRLLRRKRSVASRDILCAVAVPASDYQL